MVHILNVGQSGLRTAQTAVENVSNNIANENTPGYKKRVAQISEIGHTDDRLTGRGAVADQVYRVTNEYAYNNLIDQSTKSSYYNELSQMLSNVEATFRETENSGLSSDLDRYFQAMENLRANPQSEVYKADLVNQGNFLVDTLNRLYTEVEKQESLVKDSIDADVDKINNILNDIGQVNEQIGQHKTASNALLDKRDQLELELSEYVDVKVDRTPGEYSLEIAGFVAIRHNTNVRDIQIKDEETAQLDRFIKADGTGSNITEDITFDNEDIITYKINNEHEVSVKFGESMNFDLDGDGTPENITVDETNYVRALVNKINTNTEINSLVKAYNGTYEVDEEGKKLDHFTADKYLLVESKTSGLEGKFEGRISITEQTDASDSSTITNRDTKYKESAQSKEPVTNTVVTIYEQEINLKSGSLKAKIDNLTSESGLNSYQSYRDKLDSFARTLSDISDKYVKLDDEGNYLFGENASDEYDGSEAIKNIGLFSGSSVDTLKFDQNKVTDLTKDDLEYLAQIQWKKDISFTPNAQNSDNDNASSLGEFIQELRVNISEDKENADFMSTTQKDVVQSLQSNYDELVKVDKDEEMINLVKFQAAYSANAKIITAIDEMLQVLLGLKR